MRDRRRRWGCFTGLTLECPALTVSPFTENVFHWRFSSCTEIVIQDSYIELNFCWNCDKFLLFVTRCKLSAESPEVFARICGHRGVSAGPPSAMKHK